MLAMSAKVGRSDVNPVPMTKARPKLTEIVDLARDRNVSTALTEYGRPRAFVVSVPFVEQAEQNAAIVELLRATHPDLAAEMERGLPVFRVPLKMDESAES